jgi:uncharacterized protein (DUF2147 family)
MKFKVVATITLVASVLLTFLNTAQAQDTDKSEMTPVGVWRTIDDKTNKAKSEIKIVENEGVLTGTVISIVDPKKQTALCVKCTDDRKDKPFMGMEIIRGEHKSAGNDYWDGGTIIDPDSGKVYRLKMTPIDGGKKLDARGYLGFSLFGRTQTWERVK